MRRRYARGRPDRQATLGAALVSGALATCVGLVTFYLARLLMAREPIGDPEPQEDRAASPDSSR